MVTILLSIFPILSQLLEHAAWSIGVGIVIVVLLMLLLVYLIYNFNPRSTFSPIGIIVLGVLAILLCFQVVPLCAVIGVRVHVGDMYQWVNESLFAHYGISNIADGMAAASKSLNKYILEKFLIIVIEIAAGSFIAVKTLETKDAMRGSRRQVAPRRHRMSSPRRRR